MPQADWEPKVGDVVEYVGNGFERTSDYMGGIGIVVGMKTGCMDYTPQLQINWISYPKAGPEPILGGLWAGNCKKLTEVER